MSKALAIEPIGRFTASVRPPGSKSLTNRALLLAALAEGESTLRGVLVADDTTRMLNGLSALGFRSKVEDDGRIVKLHGGAGELPASRADLNLGNAGTAYRFLTAACCLENRTGDRGAYRLDGVSRMRRRPIDQLVDAIRRIGGKIAYPLEQGYPPLSVQGTGLRGGELSMAPTLSSQYISALLMVAPCCDNGLVIRFEGPVTSRPYVEMTVGLMGRFGAQVEVDPSFGCIRVPPGKYAATSYAVEPDASSASYLLTAAATIPDSKCTVDGLGFTSLQGDASFAEVLQQMGADVVMGHDFITVMAPPGREALKGIDIDLNHMPDMALTLAAVAPLCQSPTAIRNIGNLRIKETDRLAALQCELTKVGAEVRIDGDDLIIEPPPHNHIRPAAIDTYDDHRMAMSFAILGLATGGVVINDPDCVNKTFPDFFGYLHRLRQ